MRFGYARVSTNEQNYDLQLDALVKDGVTKDNIFTDKISTRKRSDERKGLNELYNKLRAGDEIVVWRLDRFGRTLKELITLVTDLGQQGVGFKSLTESIDTTTPGGMLIFHIFGALAEFEREIIKERTRAGLDAARARGRLGGRPRLELEPKKKAQLFALYDAKETDVASLLKTFSISRGKFYQMLKEREKNK